MTAIQLFQQILDDENLTQASAAKRLGIGRQAIGQYFQGVREMSYDTLEFYAERLGYSVVVTVKKNTPS